ncbi:unnamed protein product [Schistosoma margrebowiei]|uniref:Uncharacterized protein n=1 Tax=Schistosoma margrebowiei TaxID=48269 RepID=A0A183LKJ1_9TREM|nr:unnamed protein product [Schistosoma margrebowiei]
MKTLTFEGKQKVQWTIHNQSDSSDFTDHLALLSHTHEQMQADKDSQCSNSLCIIGSQHTQGENQHPQIQHGEQQSNHT